MAQFKTLQYYSKGNLTKKLPCIMSRKSYYVDSSPDHKSDHISFTIFMLFVCTMALLDVAGVLLIIFLIHRGV